MKSKLALVLVFIVGLSGSFVSAVEIYSEDFTTDPGFTMSNEFGIGGDADTAIWNSTNDWYQVHIKDNDDPPNNGATKFAVTPTFSRIANESFTLTFDMYYHHNSSGMGVNIWGVDGQVRDKATYGATDCQQNVGLHLNFNGSGDVRMNLVGASSATPLGGTVNTGVWYSHSLSYNSSTEIVDYVLAERGTSNVAYSVNQVMPIGAFDRLGFGHITANGNGSSSELWVDNIVVTPEPTTILLLGLGGLTLMRRRKQ